jgi:hypothetical protein
VQELKKSEIIPLLDEGLGFALVTLENRMPCAACS